MSRNDYEPIIAERRSREPAREDTQSIWRLLLVLGAGLGVAALLAWWFVSGTSSTRTAPVESSGTEIRPEAFPEEHVEDTSLPPARDLESDADVAKPPAVPASVGEPAAGAGQAAVPESVPEAVPDNAVPAPAVPAPVSVRFVSPDAQVRIELHGLSESSTPVTGKAGDVVAVAPGTYRMMASGSQLETFEQNVTFDGGRPLEYTVELCATREHERANLTGQVVEERECASTEECESMFLVLSEHADELVKDRAFRTQQCAKWRPSAAPDGKWTLDIKCGGATLATTCRVEIGEGACTFAEPRRTVRGGACPRAELK